MFLAEQQIGPYTLIRELGRGGFGAVWLAERRAALATTQVALKLPLTAHIDLAALRKEAERWVQASQPANVHVLPVFEAEIYAGQVVIAGEYAADGTLADWLKKPEHGGRAPSVEAAVTMTLGILKGLAHLHTREIVHRDLKPGNILLKCEVPCIADFGLARVLRTDVSTCRIAGTPAYMSPEVWRGERGNGGDLWAVVVMLYQMLVGKRPFSGADVDDWRRVITTTDPAPLPGTVPAPLRAVVERGLRRDEDARFASALEMHAALVRAGTNPVDVAVSSPDTVWPETGPDHGTEQLIHELRQGLRASYPGDRERAARRLGQLGPKAAEAVPTLIRAMKDASGPVRNAAVWALAAIGTPEAIRAVEEYEGRGARVEKVAAVVPPMKQPGSVPQPRTNQPPAEVFISYSSRDRERVIEIADRLEKLGVSCWLDRNKILGASNYGPEIVAGIKGCKVLLLCCSDASMRSKNVKQEIQLGWKYDRPYLPLLLEPVSFPEQLQYWLEGWQWVEAQDQQAEQWLPQLIAALVHAGVESAKAAFAQFGVDSPVIPKAKPGLEGLLSLAKFTDQIWPVPTDSVNLNTTRGGKRGLGAPQEDLQRRHRLGSRISLAIESESSGHLLLLDEGPEKLLYCLCPSWFAPDTNLAQGRSYLPQKGSRYDSFVVSGKPGRENLVAIISKEPLVTGWLPPDARMPAKVLSLDDVAQVLQKLREFPVTDWTALSTYFDVIE